MLHTLLCSPTGGGREQHRLPVAMETGGIDKGDRLTGFEAGLCFLLILLSGCEQITVGLALLLPAALQRSPRI